MMNKFIRWQGLLGFVVFSAIVVVLWLIIAPFSVKYAIEDFGSQAVGAKVEVSSVSLSFNPLGLVIHDLQVADANQPMQNAAQAMRIQADMALGPLLQGKIIIKDLNATGLALNTPRTTSGALEDDKTDNKGATNVATKGNALKVSDISDKLPSGSDILAKEPLSTVDKGLALRDGMNQSQDNIKQAMLSVPNKATIAQYKLDMAAIQQGDAKTLADYKTKQKQLSDLKQKLRTDQQALNQAKETVQNSKKTVQTQFSALKLAPKDDFNRLMAKYQLNGDGAANMSQLLFGDDISYWVKKALFWFEKVSPYLKSAKEKTNTEEALKQKRLDGRFVAFATAYSVPKFLIEEISLSIQLPQGEVVAKLHDVTNEQNITKRPATLTINSTALKGMKSLVVDGVFDLRSAPAQNIVHVNIEDWVLKNYKLGGENLALKQAKTKVVSTIKLNASGININSKANFGQASFESKAESKYGKSLAKILAGIHSFEIAGLVSGEIKQPNIQINSDLDKQIKMAVLTQLYAKKDKLAKELKAGLNDKMLSYAGPYEQQLRQLELQDASVASAKTEIEGLLSSELTAFKDEKTAQAKGKAKDKAADKVKGKFGGLKL
ncbi:MAG: TIGR03545 family protein [Ghiorsea sp.]